MGILGQTRRRFLHQTALSLAASALAAQARRPNVLWLMTDEQRPDSLGCHGSRWASSPHLDRLAAGGVLFESAYTPSPVCVPCRCSLLTGNYGSTTGVLHNQQRLRAGTKFLTWAFEEAGYQTASFGKKHYFVDGRQAFQTEGGRVTEGIVEPEHYGKGYDAALHDALQYPDAPTKGVRRRWILGGQFPAPQGESAEAKNVDLALGWLEKRDPSRPFLLRLSLNAPHTPVVAPAEFLNVIDPDKIDLPLPGDEELAVAPDRERLLLRDFEGSQVLSKAEIRKARHYYYARAAFADAEIGRLLGRMRERGWLEDTIVVFTADHGTHLGDHGLFQKQTFYDQVATVPYIFWWRGLDRRGVRLRTPAGTISLLPTLLELAGIGAGWPVEGSSLAKSVLKGEEPPAGPVFSEIQFGYQGYRDHDRQVMVREGRWKMSQFIGTKAPDGALYDLAADPGETKNLFAVREHRDTVARLQSAISHWDRNRKLGEKTQ